MQHKTVKILLGTVAALALLLVTFSAGMLAGWLLPDPIKNATPEPVALVSPVPTATATAVPGESSIAVPDVSGYSGVTPDALSEMYAPYWEAWNIIHEMYVDQPIDNEALVQGSIRGMLEALGDDHTAYMSADEYQFQNESLAGEYSGIGAWVDSTSDFLSIITPMPGSPAEKAGLIAGDKIIAVNGEDMTGVAGDTVLSKVVGEAGTSVRLTILREGEEPFEVEITRAKIVVPAVEGKLLDSNIAYVRIYTFGENTTAELRKTLREQLAQNPDGLILDLRDNGGGYLQTAIEVASEFIRSGVISYEQYGSGELERLTALGAGQATQIPMVVLINESSASASEIVAGAIQDTGRGQLVGVTSYGKGTVQQVIELNDGAGALRVTVARWLTPDKRQINKIGLTPDVEVAITEADIAAQRDSQLDKAVQVLLETIAQPVN